MADANANASELRVIADLLEYLNENFGADLPRCVQIKSVSIPLHDAEGDGIGAIVKQAASYEFVFDGR